MLAHLSSRRLGIILQYEQLGNRHLPAIGLQAHDVRSPGDAPYLLGCVVNIYLHARGTGRSWLEIIHAFVSDANKMRSLILRARQRELTLIVRFRARSFLHPSAQLEQHDIITR